MIGPDCLVIWSSSLSKKRSVSIVENYYHLARDVNLEKGAGPRALLTWQSRPGAILVSPRTAQGKYLSKAPCAVNSDDGRRSQKHLKLGDESVRDSKGSVSWDKVGGENGQ